METRGVVDRIICVLPSRDAVFLVDATESSFKLRVKTSAACMGDVPTVGETLQIYGSNEYLDVGTQLTAQLVLPEPPQQVAALQQLLLHHPLFEGASTSHVRLLCRRAGDSAIELLNSDNLANLKFLGFKISEAATLLDAWKVYCGRCKTFRFLLSQGISWRVSSRIWEVFGDHSIEIVSSDPYRMLAFSNWKEIDPAAREFFKVSAASPKRLVGACHAIFNEAVAAGRPSLTASSLRTQLVARLGTAALARKALTVGESCGAIRQSCGGKVQGVGMATIEAGLQQSLSGIAGHDVLRPTTRETRHIESLRDLLSSVQQSRVAAINAPGVVGVQLAKIVDEHVHGAVHIAPTTSFYQGHRNPESNHFLLLEVLNASPEVDNRFNGRTVVIHNASMLDLLLANKLLRRLRLVERLLILGDQYIKPSGGVGEFFPSLMNGEGMLTCEALRTYIPGESNALANWLHHLDSGFAPIRNCIGRALDGVSLIEHPDATEQALKSYRIAVETYPSSAIIICSSPKLAAAMNNILHKENVEYRKAIGEPTPLLSLRRGQTATIGDVVSYSGRDIPRGLLRGSRGLVVAVYSLEERLSLPEPSAIAEIAFDTVGTILISKEDCLYMSLGHATPLEHAVISQWAHVVVALESHYRVGCDWLRGACSRPLKSMTLVFAPGKLDQTMSHARTRERSVFNPNCSERL